MNLLNSFLSSLEVEGKSEHTLTGYRNRITRFLEHIENKDVREVTRADVQSFLCHLKNAGLSAASIAAYTVALRSWGTWLVAELWDEDWRDVFATFRLPKIPKRIPQTIEQDDIEKMLELMPRQNKVQKRNYALVLFLYTTGLRVSECSSVDIQDVDLDERIVFVQQGKGAKDRYSFLTPRAIAALRSWLHVRKSFENADSKALWIGRGSNRLDRRIIEHIVSKAADQAGLEATPHTLRRSRATHMRNDGVRVDVISTMLGHVDVRTTEKAYLNADPLAIRDMAEANYG
jgi:site-specific recombinase XerD